MPSRSLRKWSCTGAYALLHSATWSFYAIVLAFSSNVLYEFGFSDSAISLFLGICTGLSVIIQLTAAEYLSRNPRLPVYRLLVLLGAVMLLGCAVLLIPAAPRFLQVLGFALPCIFLQMLPSFTNALGMDSIKHGAPTSYSLARGTGSLAYSASAMVTGVLVRSLGVRMVFWLAAIMAVLLMISAIWYHKAADVSLPPQETAKEARKESFLRKYPRFALFLVGTVFLAVSHSLLCNFMFQIMLAKNGGTVEQGVATSISALVELPVMYGFPLLLRFLRCDKWVRFAAVSMVLKPLGILLATAPGGIYLAQATQMIGYGLLIIGSVNYAERIVEGGESIRAQSYHGSAVATSTLIALSIGGVIIDHFGVQAMVAVSLGCSVIGNCIIAFGIQKTK